jgi:acyl-CoA reductase-like NAD-dependent aldehyde dehydrogenase
MLQDADLLALQEVRTKVEKAYAAWLKYRAYSQEQIDAVVERMAAAGREHARRLAELAVEETKYGNARDKTAKNLLAADLLAKAIRNVRTVGVLRECPEKKMVEIAVPMGVIAAILPTTNPTSTAIYKILISLKAANAIVLSPHPRARRCTCETADVLLRAAIEAGAPADIIQCVEAGSIEATNELMRHRRTAAILSTGGSGIVRAAYSSGKPAFGVGPGNVPVVIDKSADIPDAVSKLVSGKSFDYGTLCSSEQTLIAERGIRDQILSSLLSSKAFLCNDQQREALTKVLLAPPRWSVNPECVGQAAPKIAQMAGFDVPPDTAVLVAEIAGIGPEHPLSAEKLSPVLSLLFVNDFAAALDAAEAVLKFHGLGHTCGIYSRDDKRTREFALRMPAMRILCNTPTPQGSVGITTNLQPSMTLGCGAIAGNITGDNIGPKHLINIKRLAYVARAAEEAFDMPAEQPVRTASKTAAATASVMSSVKSQVSAAVERYLAERGLWNTAGHSGQTGTAKSQINPVAPRESNTAEIVDRFLAGLRPSPRVETAPACPAPGQHTAPPPETNTPAGRGAPVTPAVQIADFVGEQEVRAAIQKSQKIYIGPKTIVTPLARDLAAVHDTLVMAQRK